MNDDRKTDESCCFGATPSSANESTPVMEQSNGTSDGHRGPYKERQSLTEHDLSIDENKDGAQKASEKLCDGRLSAAAGFVAAHKRPLQLVFMGLMLAAVFFAVKSEISHINLKEIQKLSHEMLLWDKIKFVVFGLGAFCFCSSYDFVLAHRFKLDVRARDLFRIGWIAQSFNNFIGFGGVTGGTLRLKLYESVGVDEEKALKVSAGILVSTLLGLFVLAFPASIGLHALGESKYLPVYLLMFLLTVFYVFGDLLPIAILHHERSPLHFLSRKTRIETLVASSVEWFMAALFFAYALRYFDSGVPWTVGILVYTIATAIGIVSMVPGGLGTFDGAVLAIMAVLGYDSSHVVMALLAERVIYTFLPWLIGLFGLSAYAFQNRFNADTWLRASRLMTRFISIGIFLSGCILFFSAATPEIFWRLHMLHHYVPHIVPLFSRMVTIFLALLLIILSRGIRLQVRRAQVVTTVVLLVAAMSCILKGLDYEEAAVMVVFAIILLLTRSLFVNQAVALNRRTFAQLMFALLVGCGVFAGLYHLAARIFYNKLTVVNFVAAHPLGPWVMVGFMFMVGAVSFATLTTRRHFLAFESPSAEDHANFEALCEKYGGGMFGHLHHMNDKMIYFNENRTVAMLYRPVKQHIFVLGDPVGNPEDVDDAIGSLVRWAGQMDMVVSFYEISGRYLVPFIDEGFRFLKMGEDALVDLTTFSLSGKKNRGLRNTRSAMEKNGYTFQVAHPPHSAEKLAAWQRISDKWLGDEKEMQFSLGSFYEPYLQSAPVFELVDTEGVPVAFANMMPHVGGGVLSIDLMRYDITNEDNVMDMMFISLFEWAKEAGYTAFDLGVSPLANVGRGHYSDGREKMVRIAYEFGTRIYSFSGLNHFKSKFRPNWQPVYLAYKDNRILTDVLINLVLLIHKTPERDTLRDLELGDKDLDELMFKAKFSCK